MKTVYNMENTSGEPDVVVIDGLVYYVDMYRETPKCRSSVCYDQAARLARAKLPPKTSAQEMLTEIGSDLLDEAMYLTIQSKEDSDLKTSCWLKTSKEVRALGGALFGDKRYGRVFVYHNGADSYYGSRGFRGYIKI